MLKSKRIAKDFISIDVGKAYDQEPHYWTTLYYYKGLILDTGCPHTAEETVDFFKKLKLQIEAILLTHCHEDHSGGAYLLRKTFGVDVFAPKKSLKILANPPDIPVYRQMVWGQPKPVKAKPLRKTLEFDFGAIHIIDTPGHSFDHVSFLVDNILFTGDLITNPSPIIIMRDEDYTDVIRSLRAIMKLDFERAYGGHGIWNKNTVEETLNNILHLRERVNMLHKLGLTVEQIAEELFSDVPKKVLSMEELSEYEWSRRNLVESLLGRRH